MSPRPSALVHIRPQVHSPSAAFACDNVLYHTLGEPGRGPVKKRCYPFSHDSRNHRAFAGPPAGAFFHTRKNRPLRSLAPRRERIENQPFRSPGNKQGTHSQNQPIRFPALGLLHHELFKVVTLATLADPNSARVICFLRLILWKDRWCLRVLRLSVRFEGVLASRFIIRIAFGIVRFTFGNFVVFHIIGTRATSPLTRKNNSQ